jgi:hypothetical protein
MKTLAPFSITQTTAGSGGFSVTGSITEKGVVWSTTKNPTWSFGVTTNTSSLTTTSLANYVVWITGLAPNTKYYVRAYSIISNSPVYGNEFSFITKAIIDGDTTPVCTTKDITLNPGQVYNVPPDAEVVALTATAEQAEKLKSDCSTFQAILTELTSGGSSE